MQHCEETAIFSSRKTERRNGIKKNGLDLDNIASNKQASSSISKSWMWLPRHKPHAFYCVSNSEAVIQLLSYSKASVDPNLCELKWNSSTANLQLVHFCELTQAHCSETETRGIIVCLQQLSDCLPTLHLLQFCWKHPPIGKMSAAIQQLDLVTEFSRSARYMWSILPFVPRNFLPLLFNSPPQQNRIWQLTRKSHLCMTTSWVIRTLNGSKCFCQPVFIFLKYSWGCKHNQAAMSVTWPRT